MIPEQLLRSLFIAKKDLTIYYLKGPVVIFGILLPLFFFLAFWMGRDMSDLALSVALTGMVLWFTSTSISPVVAPWETRTGTLERLIFSPVEDQWLIMGDVIASSLLGIALTAVPVIITALLLDVTVTNPLLLLLGVVLASVCFSAIGVLMAAYPTDSPANIMLIASLVKFPVIFISGIFISLSELPGWARIVSYCSPLTYFIDLANHCNGGEGEPLLDLTMLLLFGVLFIGLAIAAHRRTLLKRI
jgi:ABC-2 type transport system permease protein